MSLPPISDEQQDVVNSICKSQNVIVESVAGSGKTTCNIYIAKSCPTKSILLLTYNAKLKMETRERVSALGIANIETHSYHSFCVKYYNPKCFTDYQIINIVKANTIQVKSFRYDLIILDEAQDISPLYHELICKIFVDNFNPNCQICLLGDRAQSIYDFNRADARFIVYADKIFNLNAYPWVRCSLSQSYRVTSETAQFVNNCMGKQFGIKSTKSNGSKPKYLITDSFSESVFCKQFVELKSCLKKYKPEEIFILAPSVKNEKSPVRQLENLIKKNLKNVPVYVPVSDEEKLDEQVLRNKLVFSTFHQAKGLERKAVFVYGFDDSYFKFFKKDKDPKVCPNELYVATTRALEHLVLIHGITNNYLPFLNKNALDKYATVIKDGELQLQKYQVTKTYEVTVTDLIKHLPVDVLNNCIEYLTITKSRPKADKINIPFKSEQQQGYESLGEITGTAIPSYLQYKTSGTMSIYTASIQYSKETDPEDIDQTNSPDFLDSDCSDSDNGIKISSPKYDLEKINLSKIKPDELLYIANYYCAKKSGFLYKIYQITNYNWLSQENLNIAYERLVQLGISKKAKYEQYFEISKLSELLDRRLYGYVDCIDGNNIYEFKCVNKLENEHYLQLAVYMFLYESNIRKQANNVTAVQIITNPNKTNMPDLYLDMIAYLEINNKKLLTETRAVERARLEDLNNRIMTLIAQQFGHLTGQTETTNNSKTSTKTDSNSETNNYFLYNILTDEMEQISCSYENLKAMCKYLFHAKYLGSKEIPDDIFIKTVCEVLTKYKQVMADTLDENNAIGNINKAKIPSVPTKLIDTVKVKQADTINQTDQTNSNILEWEGKKYFIQGTKAYQLKKDGTKGRAYGTYINSQLIKSQPKSKEIDI